MALSRRLVWALSRHWSTICRIYSTTRTNPNLNNSDNNSTKKGPLSGVTVVGLEQAIAAPFCTRQLADLGARVIKIERPGVGDICAESYAYSSILAALFEREKDPARRGWSIDISMLECMVEWMGFLLYYAFEGQGGPKPAGASHAAIYPCGPFEAKQGIVMLGIQNEQEWANFCKIVLEESGLTIDECFCNNTLRPKIRVALKEIICGKLAQYSAEEGVWNHPQLKARQRLTQVQTPAGSVPALFPPGTGPNGFEAQMGAVLKVGEHNEAISAGLGIAVDE